MAKENTVILYGMLERPPVVRVTNDGDYVSGRITLSTVRRSFVNEDFEMRGPIRMDFPCVFSKNDKIIKYEIEPLKKGDIVLVKGSLCTLDTEKTFYCPQCGEKVALEQAVVVYIDPLDIKRVIEAPAFMEDGIPGGIKWEEWEMKSFRELVHNDEFSNLAMVMGTVIRDPDYYSEGPDGKKECQFQIVCPRKRRIKEDPPDKNADFPWVKIYGVKAEEAFDALSEGSKIYINGAIQTRSFQRQFNCKYCGPFEKEAGASEIVPYDIEYMENCNLPESTHLNDEEGYDA